MENISENTRRGRPPVMDANYRKTFRVIYPEGGDRTLNNRMYAIEAYRHLKDNPECAWLFEADEQGDYKRGTLQTEIGRLLMPEVMLDVAKVLCKQKPTVKRGVVMVRSFRMALQGKKQPSGSPEKLAEELRNVINDYLFRYPETPKDVFFLALDILGRNIESSLE